MTTEFLEMVKDEATERLSDYKGNTCYLCELGSNLTQNENMDGSWSCSAYRDKENIKNYFEDCGDFWEWYKNNFGESCEYNPFEDSERFFCLVMIFAIENVVDYAINETLQEKWNDETKINDEIIATITEALEKVQEVF